MSKIVALLWLLLAPGYTPSLKTPDLTCRERGADGTVVRSVARRTLFLRMLGVPHPNRVPEGYAVNHIVPLACGGCDVPSNMELMTVETWRGRIGPERLDCGRHPGGEWRQPPEEE